MSKLPLTSHDVLADKIARIREEFPEVFSEGKIDFERLKMALGEYVDNKPERYGLTWAGKSDAIRNIQAPSVGTLLPVPEESVNFDTSENLIIEGDNLEVLKLLQKSYHGKIKMIYIDPPYNTGNEFIYPDNFREGLENYLRYSGQVDGNGVKLSTNTETDGRFHSKWLNMMYPRLFLARNLLRDDGVICVSICDAELANLRKIMDEIFGEENYINTISVKVKVSAGASGGGEDKRLKKNIEFIMIYAKQYEAVEGLNELYQESPLMREIEEMRANGQSWKYTSVLLRAGERKKVKTITDGEGNPIDIYLRENVQRTTIARIMREEGLSEEEAY